MKILLSELQYKNLVEQSSYEKGIMDRSSNMLDKISNVDPHTLMTITQIGTAFIPVVGVFISASIGLADAGMYYNEGDKTSAGITAAFSMLPFVSKIPGVKKLGSKGMALLASKLGKGVKNLTEIEIGVLNAVAKEGDMVKSQLNKVSAKLSRLGNQLDLYRKNYITKYGENEYTALLWKYLYGGVDEQSFVQTLKNVKNPNIRIKPAIGGGADHRVFQSAIHADQVIKAEIRPGEVNLWYNTFKKYPKVFANVIKKAKVKGTNGAMMDAVVLEKLNTEPFMNLWTNMESLLIKMERQNPGSPMVGLESTLKNIQNPAFKNVWNNFLTYVKQNNPSIFGKVNELNVMVGELYKITPKPDIRQFNFGYDKNGLLKALDL
jgi:hypothetical protein